MGHQPSQVRIPTTSMSAESLAACACAPGTLGQATSSGSCLPVQRVLEVWCCMGAARLQGGEDGIGRSDLLTPCRPEKSTSLWVRGTHSRQHPWALPGSPKPHVTYIFSGVHSQQLTVMPWVAVGILWAGGGTLSWSLSNGEMVGELCRKGKHHAATEAAGGRSGKEDQATWHKHP